MPLKHGPIEGLLAVDYLRDTSQFSMPLKHGPIEGRFDCCFAIVFRMFSMPLKHGPIEGESLVMRLPQPGETFSMPLKHGPIEGWYANQLFVDVRKRFPCP